MSEVRNKIFNFFRTGLWEIDVSSLGKFNSLLIKSLRLVNVIFDELTDGQLALRATSLVYTTLLSIVPVLAISFSLLKSFGVHNELVEPFLLKFLEPLGSKGEEITYRIISFVENVKVGVLGSLGLGMLIYTVVTVIQKVEDSFNKIWMIKKSRSLSRRFSDYISVIIIGPVLIFSAMGLTATLMSNTVVLKILSIEPLGTLFYFLVEKLPYLMVCAAFTFLYAFLPNTKVKLKSALAGGVIAGIIWEAAGWGFASFVVTSTNYAAIYSGFAIIIVFMIWLYLSWLILLIGAYISFYHQYPYFLSSQIDLSRLSNRLRERLALSIMYLIAHNYYLNKPSWTINSIVERLGTPAGPVSDIIVLMEKNALLVESADDPPSYLPSKDIEKITLAEIFNVIRTGDKEVLYIEQRMTSVQEVESLMEGLDNSYAEMLDEKTLKDLVLHRQEKTCIS